jgi:hypothetical protein
VSASEYLKIAAELDPLDVPPDYEADTRRTFEGPSAMLMALVHEVVSLREERSARLEHRGADREYLAWEATAKAYAKQRPPGEGVEAEALWGEDAEAVEVAVDALFGHHPERGGAEREQAAYAVVLAVKRVLLSKVVAELRDEVFQNDGGAADFIDRRFRSVGDGDGS